MTEGNQDDATQQLSENNKADEKPVQDGSEQRTDSSLQLASGVPGDGDHPVQGESKQEDESEKVDQSKPADSSSQEPGAGEGVTVPSESGEPVQAVDGETPVKSEEQVQKESGDDKPAENEGNTDNTEEGKGENGQSEDSIDGRKQSETQDAEQTERAEESVPQIPSKEQQGEEKPEGESEEAQKAGEEQEEGGTQSANQVEQQEMLAPSHEEGDKPAQGEGEAENSVAESESQETTEKQESEQTAGEKAEDRQTDGDAINESSPNENIPESEDHSVQEGSQAEAVKDSETPKEDQKSDEGIEKPDGAENAQENQTVEDKSAESEPITDKQEQRLGEVDKPVENELQVQSEAMSASQPVGATTVQVVTLPVDESTPKKPDEVQEENKKLKQDIFMMKQQEDAYRIKVLSLEQEVAKLRARKIDNRSQDSLASDSDSYLKQKLAETERELDTAERKVKDLQLRLKRFAKDDQIKDEKIFQMEREVKELSEHIKKLEQSLAESKRENNNNATSVQASTNKNDSKVCVIL